MMELTAAMIANKSLFIEPYVAALVPPVLTCLIGRSLGPETPSNLQAQFQLRDLAASLIGQISTKYAESSLQLRPRLARTCLKYFLDPSRSLAEHYGAISGLISIGGPEGIRSVLLPNIKPFEYVIQKAQNERGATYESVRMIITVLLRAVTSIVDAPLTNGNGANGANGTVAAEAPLVEEYLGSIVGSRVNALSNRALCKAILEARDRN
jgi:transcription initiation factor TFIID subunit 6